jgi:PST family polysaccharide transporter
MRLGLVHAFLAIIAYVVGVRWGIVGVSACYCAASLVYFFYCFSATLRSVSRTWRDLFTATRVPAALTVALASVLTVADPHLVAWGAGPLARCLLLGSLGAALYGGGLLAFAKPTLDPFFPRSSGGTSPLP